MASNTNNIDLREFILKELRKQGKSRYWLGMRIKEARVANRETVLRYLRGDRDTSGGVIAAMLRILGVSIANSSEDGRTTASMRANPVVTHPVKRAAKTKAATAAATR